jgi:hypothetical protein
VPVEHGHEGSKGAHDYAHAVTRGYDRDWHGYDRDSRRLFRVSVRVLQRCTFHPDSSLRGRGGARMYVFACVCMCMSGYVCIRMDTSQHVCICMYKLTTCNIYIYIYIYIYII